MDSADGAGDPRPHFLAKLSDLKGRSVSGVDYWDVHNFGPEPPEWDYGDWHHAVMGVQLTTDRGPVTITWTDTFFPYGVEVFHEQIEESLILGDIGPQRIGPDAGGAGPWNRLFGSPIRGTGCEWERLTIGPGRRADGTIVSPARVLDVPVAVRLDFPAGPVWFVAAIPQAPAMASVFIPGDEIMVVFSEAKMRNMGFTNPVFLLAGSIGGD